MKTSVQLLLQRAASLLSSHPKSKFLLSNPIWSAATEHTLLTQEELTEINLLVPRLCESNHFPEAIRLIDAALLTNPPLKSLPLSVLIDRLTAEPDMTQSMSLLNHLKHNPNAHPALAPINQMFLVSYFKKHRFKEAMKIFSWMSRPDSPCNPDAMVYRIVIGGFCRNGKTLEALKVMRAMLGANTIPDTDLRTWVYRSLLREARIGEAQEWNQTLVSIGNGEHLVPESLGVYRNIQVENAACYCGSLHCKRVD
ncbi:hypothetical protein NE237_001982 [Protea cynaroides]|uniref:Pentatricopeptide repeat-containing protein n=1 Tax=Protea cynaroides TaxID=273540 RepID=A0A9Q0KV06_9MAGN|nr:hypothetical protein NE237_001982 [Protea cynaroides]